jgi:sulfite reductase (ferredoxin)
MKSFRSEIENPVVEQDIIELERKIAHFKMGLIQEEKFRSLRLARGVYGQRQEGVQMIRIKIPFGKLNAHKLRRIAKVSDTYSRGRLHITTRQDIQIHHVSLDRTPELWAELEKDNITLRESCGNTVRNITASELSGIDPNEPFDPRVHADAMFQYFLRNPICQDMGRKFKISFSNNEDDTALAFMHDLGFIAKEHKLDGQKVKGFQVWVGGGLGSQSTQAHLLRDFVSADEIIPLSEAIIRVFERYGERSRRQKARLKFLIKDWGFETFRKKVEQELLVLDPIFEISYVEEEIEVKHLNTFGEIQLENRDEFNLWKRNNIKKQKNGQYAVGVKVRIGDFYTNQAQALADIIETYAGDELTLTINQNIIIRHANEEALPYIYRALKVIGLADIGFNTFTDITACPGTDTCNLGIANSTSLAQILETVIAEEYPELRNDTSLNIKISGCMNACGQHMISAIGFQGMSIKDKAKKVLPAVQFLLGGGRLGNGQGRFGDKVIKIPSKRAPKALRTLLDDFLANKEKSQSFLDYYDRNGEIYFYNLLSPFADIETLEDDDYVDWGYNAPYIKAIGIGECAGVVVDLVSTLFYDSEEKLELSKRTLEDGVFKDSIYHSYAAMVNTAKALLLSKSQKTNSHQGIISNFDKNFIDTSKFELQSSFKDFILRIKTEKASSEFAIKYYEDAFNFYRQADTYRKKELKNAIKKSN